MVAWVGFVPDLLLFAPTAGEDAAVCAMPGRDLRTSAVL